jgi:hypothetical protein
MPGPGKTGNIHPPTPPAWGPDYQTLLSRTGRSQGPKAQPISLSHNAHVSPMELRVRETSLSKLHFFQHKLGIDVADSPTLAL